jgi:hypothetical protein
MQKLGVQPMETEEETSFVGIVTKANTEISDKE